MRSRRPKAPTLFELARAFLGDEVAGTDEDLYDAWLRVKEPEVFEEEDPDEEPDSDRDAARLRFLRLPVDPVEGGAL